MDPQWLCDMLAHVVTIREINPFARTGIMKLDDLKHIFKASNIGSVDTRGYIVNLLNKFEVALTWDSRTLLIPSLLPSEEDIIMAQLYPGQFHPMVKVKVPLRSRGWAIRNKKISISSKSVLFRDASSLRNFELTLPSSKVSSNNLGKFIILKLYFFEKIDGVKTEDKHFHCHRWNSCYTWNSFSSYFLNTALFGRNYISDISRWSEKILWMNNISPDAILFLSFSLRTLSIDEIFSPCKSMSGKDSSLANWRIFRSNFVNERFPPRGDILVDKSLHQKFSQ